MLQLADIGLELNENAEAKEILRNLSLTFEPGKLYVITGPNGGGKTSVAKTIMGIYQPNAGRILLDGRDITALSITDRARLGIRYAFQTPPRFKGIDVRWYLRLADPDTDEQRQRAALRQIGLCPEDYLGRLVDSTLSGGEIKRLEVASVLLGSTRVALLDEPEAGVDLWGFEQLLQLIIRAHRRAKNRTTIVISHSEKFLEQADEIIVLAGGEVQARGPMAAIRPLLDEGIHCQWRTTCAEEDEDEQAQCRR